MILSNLCLSSLPFCLTCFDFEKVNVGPVFAHLNSAKNKLLQIICYSKELYALDQHVIIVHGIPISFLKRRKKKM